MKKIATLLLATAFINSYAQHKTCGATEINNAALASDLQFAENHKQLENFTKQFTQNQPVAKTNAVATTCNKIIPVVVHIIHNNGIENVSDAQVNDAIRILNEDFQKKNPDTVSLSATFKPIASAPGIEFRLAKKDPNGNATTGITRTVSALTSSADDNVKALIDWDASKYLNIWVVKTISFGAGGYAYFPGANASVDGIVIVCYQFGGIGASYGTNFAKRSLTHEVGHYLNLYHVWGNNNAVATPAPAGCSGSDEVDDTPPTIGTDQSCGLTQNTCGQIDNVQNFMDYSTCCRMYTKGQSDRMTAALYSTIGNRKNLWQPANLIATGTDYSPMTLCGVDLFPNLSTLCLGASTSFSSVAWSGTPTTYSWSFPGGNPSTSGSASPTVTYVSGGTFDVSLTVTNGNGSATITKTGLMKVSSSATYNGTYYSESFEGITLPNADFSINNSDGDATFTQTSSAAVTGVSSATLNNFGVSGTGKIDELIAPSFNLSNIPNKTITFKYAYAQKTAADNDKLEVYVSNNCGQAWAVRFSKSGSALSTGGVQTATFTPNGTQWASGSATFPSTYNTSTNVLFKFKFTSGGGNNLFIDDINIGTPTGVEGSAFNPYNISIYPNPASQQLNVSIDMPERGQVLVEVVDMLGNTIHIYNPGTVNAGNHIYTLNPTWQAGVYIVKTTIYGEVSVKKVNVL